MSLSVSLYVFRKTPALPYVDSSQSQMIIGVSFIELQNAIPPRKRCSDKSCLQHKLLGKLRCFSWTACRKQNL